MDHGAAFARLSAAALVACLLLAAPVLAGPGSGSDQEKEAARVAKKVEKARKSAAHEAEEDREALRHFRDEVADYDELQARLLARLGAREPVERQQALARTMAARRARARQGDVFRPEVQPVFRRLVAEQLVGPDTQAARKAVLEGNPGQDRDAAPIVVRINAPYPAGAPRSTVPPSVLAVLPPLPASLHYRFVGRDLVLLDSVTQLVVDLLPAAVPGSVTR